MVENPEFDPDATHRNENGTIDVVQGRSITINEKGQQVYATPALYPESTLVYSINTLSDEQLLKHLLSTPIALWTCLIRKEFQKDIELGDYIYNDTDFIWKLKILAKTFVYAPEYIYRQNEHADSVSGSAHTSTNNLLLINYGYCLHYLSLG